MNKSSFGSSENNNWWIIDQIMYLHTKYIFCTKMKKNFLLLSVTISQFFSYLNDEKTHAFHFSLSNCSLFLQVWSLLLLTLFLKAVVFFEATFVRKIELKLSLLFFVLLSSIRRSGSVYREFEPRQLTSHVSCWVESWLLSSKCSSNNSRRKKSECESFFPKATN